MFNEIKVPIMYDGESLELVEDLKRKVCKDVFYSICQKIATIDLDKILKIQVNSMSGYGYNVYIANLYSNGIWIDTLHIDMDGEITTDSEDIVL